MLSIINSVALGTLAIATVVNMVFVRYLVKSDKFDRIELAEIRTQELVQEAHEHGYTGVQILRGVNLMMEELTPYEIGMASFADLEDCIHRTVPRNAVKSDDVAEG